MKRLLVILSTLAVIASPAFAIDTPAPSTPALPAPVLTKPYAITLGDMLAMCITQTMPVLKSPWGFDADAMASYDHQSGKIQVTIYGSRVSVDEAKGSMEFFRSKVLPPLLVQVAKSYHVGLDESSLTIIYVTKTTMHEVIRRESDKYLVAE